MSTLTKLLNLELERSEAENACSVARDKFYDSLNIYRHELQPSKRSVKRWQDNWEWKKHLVRELEHAIYLFQESNEKKVSH